MEKENFLGQSNGGKEGDKEYDGDRENRDNFHKVFKEIRKKLGIKTQDKLSSIYKNWKDKNKYTAPELTQARISKMESVKNGELPGEIFFIVLLNFFKDLDTHDQVKLEIEALEEYYCSSKCKSKEKIYHPLKNNSANKGEERKDKLSKKIYTLQPEKRALVDFFVDIISKASMEEIKYYRFFLEKFDVVK